jgi:O-antigen/teichoic acid export membrane protein
LENLWKTREHLVAMASAIIARTWRAGALPLIGKLRGELPALVGFALLPLIFYWPVLFGSAVLLPLDNLWTKPPWFGPPGAVPHNGLISDMILQNYPWKLILEQAWRQRELPLWNPYEMAGLPYLGTGQTGALYPFTALFLILGPLRAYGWYSVLHQFLAATLTYGFGRRLGLGRTGSAVAGIVFAFCFFLTVSYIWPMVLGAAVWLPLGLWSVTGLARAAAQGGFARSLAIDLPLGALATALSVLGGHLEITFYATFALALYVIYLGVQLWLGGDRPASGRFVLAAAGAVALGVLIAAVQLVPFLEVLQTNNRQGDTTYCQVISYALPHRQVFGLLLPDFFGNPAIHDYLDLTTLKTTPIERNALGRPIDNAFWGTKNYVEAGGYVGVVPLLLALVAALRSRHRERWFFLGLAGLAVLLAFGTPLYALIYYGLPFFSQLRTPFRWLYLLDFALAMLAGMGLDSVMRRQAVSGDRSQKQSAGPVKELASHDRQRSSFTSPGSWLLILPSSFVRWLPAFIGVLGLFALAGSFVVRGRSATFADRILARSPELQQAFASGAMLYSFEFHNLAVFFGLLTLGGVLIGLLLSDWRLGVFEVDANSGIVVRPSPPPSPSGRGGNILAPFDRLSTGRMTTAESDPPLPRGESGGEGRTTHSIRSSKSVWLAPHQLRNLCALLLIATIVADLFYFGTAFSTKSSAVILQQHLDLTQIIRPDPAGPRVASLADPYVLPANLGTALGIPTVGGYDTIISAGFVRLWSLIEAPVDLPYNQIGRLHRLDSLGSPILDLLGVRYVLSEVPADHPAARLATQIGPIRVYERPSALPRVFIVGSARSVGSADEAFRAMARPDFRPAQVVLLEGGASSDGGGQGTTVIQTYDLDRLTISTTVQGTGWLVLTDQLAPGWSATVDGAATPVLPADGIFRAVRLTTGTHQVAFRYLPLSLQYGGYGTFLGLIVLGIVGTLPLWRRLTGQFAGSAERVFRNSTLPMVTSFLNKAIDFGFAALMLRVLGVTNVGEYTTAVILVGYFEIFTNFGLNGLIIREVARDRDETSRYLANAVALRLALCLVALPVAGAVFWFGRAWFRLGTPGVVVFALLALALIPSNVTGALSALFNGWERNDVPAVVTVATTLARVTLGAIALLSGSGIVGLAAVALGLNFALIVVFAVSARRILHVRLIRPVLADFPAMIAESYPLFLNVVLVTIFFKIDIVLLEMLKGSQTVGYYATAYKWVDGLLIVPSTLTFAVYPALSRFAEQRSEGLRAAYEASVRALVCLALPLAIGVAFLSGDLILLLGGWAYFPQSADALTILIWFLPFSFVNGLTQYALIAVHRQRFITVAFVIAASFNLVANLLFIPTYGFYAASVVTVLSEIVLLVPFLIAVRQSIGWPKWSHTVGKPLLAGGLMLLVALASRQVEIHVGLVAAVLIYIAALRALGVFSPEEIAILRRLVQRRKVVPATA